MVSHGYVTQVTEFTDLDQFNGFHLTKMKNGEGTAKTLPNKMLC